MWTEAHTDPPLKGAVERLCLGRTELSKGPFEGRKSHRYLAPNRPRFDASSMRTSTALGQSQGSVQRGGRPITGLSPARRSTNHRAQSSSATDQSQGSVQRGDRPITGTHTDHNRRQCTAQPITMHCPTHG